MAGVTGSTSCRLRFPSCFAHLQVEQMYNKLLDESDRFREDMGDITDNVSLETALETAWDELESKTGALHGT